MAHISIKSGKIEGKAGQMFKNKNSTSENEHNSCVFKMQKSGAWFQRDTLVYKSRFIPWSSSQT